MIVQVGLQQEAKFRLLLKKVLQIYNLKWFVFSSLPSFRNSNNIINSEINLHKSACVNKTVYII